MPDFTITRRGRRASTAQAYLDPARRRPNLTVMTDAPVHRILIEDGRAGGVLFCVGDQERIARANAEVLLCGGAINSPQLLMLSGIGPAADLRGLGITFIVTGLMAFGFQIFGGIQL